MIRKAWLLTVFISVCAASVLAQQTTTTTQQPAPPKTHLKVGQEAPDFTLTDTAGKEVKLSHFKGKKNVVLAFYVLAFTGG
jgi:cytochrome oxidase Cu insertion factor (SCO1/SenC/PrrC family)